MRYIQTSIATIAFLITSAACGVGMAQQTIQLTNHSPSSNNKVVIAGQIDLPTIGSPPYPAVIMVPGTGGFDRDVAFGKSGTEDDKLFLSISRQLTARGFAVARYDTRGAGLSVRTRTTATVKASKQTISRESGAADIVAFYKQVVASGKVDASRTVFFAHSEGMLNLARVVEGNKIPVRRVVGMGAILASPAGTLRWQLQERVVQALGAMDTNADGYLSNDEIERQYKDSILPVYGGIENYLSPHGGWTAEQLKVVKSDWAAVYGKAQKDALDHKKNELYSMGNEAVSSYDWWQQWFDDDKPVVARLISGRPCAISLHYGTKDSQLLLAEQLKFVPKLATSTPYVNVATYQGLGHSLGEHTLFAPIDSDALSRVAADIQRVASLKCEEMPEGPDVNGHLGWD